MQQLMKSKSQRRSKSKNKRPPLLKKSDTKTLAVLLCTCVVAAILIGIKILYFSHAQSTIPGVSISGNQFYLDGQPFVPQGFDSLALLDAEGCSTAETVGAANNFGPTEFNNLKNKWYSNTVRIHVAQPALTGPNGVAYAQLVETDVNELRKAGFAVMLDMQDEVEACGASIPLPGQDTKQAWTTLITNTRLKDDPYIMFEILNEPGNTNNPAVSTDPTVWNWPDWQNGGRQIQSPGNNWPAYTPVGHQQMVNYFRTTLKVNNVIIVDGASHAETLKNVPLIQDPGGNNQIAYAVHPFDYWTKDSTIDWDDRWGIFAKSYPVTINAWSCNPGATTTDISDFLSYARSHNESIIGFPLDIFDPTGTYAWRFMKDTAMDPNVCGKQYQTDYTNFFAPTPTPAPTTTPTPIRTSTPTPTATPSASASPTPSPSSSPSEGDGGGSGGSGSGTVQVAPPGATVKIDGIPADVTNGQLDTTYLPNGNYQISVTHDGKTTTSTLVVHNKLNPFEWLRDFLFARFTDNHVLMNIGTIIVILVPVIALSWIIRNQLVHLVTRLLAKLAS